MSPNKTQIYKLIARNGTESIEKELKIEINANPLQKWLIAAIIALPLLFFGYKGWEGMRLNSMDCHTAFNTANKLYQKENYGSASAYFKRSIEAGGLTKEEVAESHYHLAVSLRESGGKAAAADANKHFDDAIRLYTDLKNLPMLDEVVRKSLEK